MKKTSFIILLLLIILTGNCFARSFVFDGETINLIDFPEFKHINNGEVVSNLKATAGVDVKDILAHTNKERMFVVGTMPAFQFIAGYKWTEKQFALARKNVVEQLPEMYNTKDLQKEFKDGTIPLYITEVLDPKIIINTDNCIGYIVVAKADGVNNNDYNLTFISMVLVKGKIISVMYYTPYTSSEDYEHSKEICIKFVDKFITSNR